MIKGNLVKFNKANTKGRIQYEDVTQFFPNKHMHLPFKQNMAITYFPLHPT